MNNELHLLPVARWGDALAIRLPAVVVEELNLIEGDRIEIRVVGKHHFEVERDRSTERALEGLRRLRRPLPPGFRSSRTDANARE